MRRGAGMVEGRGGGAVIHEEEGDGVERLTFCISASCLLPLTVRGSGYETLASKGKRLQEILGHQIRGAKGCSALPLLSKDSGRGSRCCRSPDAGGWTPDGRKAGVWTE